MSEPRFRFGTAPCAVLALAGGLLAQGKFVNYEDPQVKPVAIAACGTHDYVLVCNTPDNSVEIYKAEWSLQAPIARVGVGLSPVTVKWDPSTNCFFTCNYLGDSVTRVSLEVVPASGSAPETVRAWLEQTEYVGDEPSDIAFDPSAGTAVVTLHASGSVIRINKGDLSAVTGVEPIGAFIPAGFTNSTAPFVPFVGPLPFWFLKQARRVEILRDTRGYVLNTMGGEQGGRSPYDFGMAAIVPVSSGGLAIHPVGTIGSTVLGCAVNATQDKMFIVSQIAQNLDRNGVDEVNDEPTGFVQTWLKVVDLPTNGSAPTVRSDPTGVAGTTLPSIDLNRNYGTPSPVTPMPAGDRLAQVTDVVLVPNPTPGQPELVVLAGFGSECIAILTPSTANANGYTRQFVPIGKQSTGSYSAAGPRGLAFSARSSQPGSGTTGLVFVMNRLDNSVAVVNPYAPATTTVVGRPLANDPTPDIIRIGRKFLYTATATSGLEQENMVSCSSCHVDARTDGLRWRLGDLHDGVVIADRLVDGIDMSDGVIPRNANSEPIFPKDKPETVTQTLQGLVNSHLEPDSMQWLTTNAPYHWRGDKESFTDFNEAFVNLQRMSSPFSTNPPLGISPSDMEDYASFINTIHHPPNPQQAWDRVYHGSIGDPNLLDDSPAHNGTASGTQWGMKLFHVAGVDAFLEGRSCVNCHSLPEGSSNTLTIVSLVAGGLSSTTTGGTGIPPTSTNPAPDVWHPFETAALRNVAPRELLVPDGYSISGAWPVWPINGSSGLHHGGVSSVPGVASFTVNDNVHGTFGPLAPFNPSQATALTAFLRQLDTGTAPMIGVAWTMFPGSSWIGTPLADAVLQAEEANVGIAVYLRSQGSEYGFWYDVHQSAFVEEGGGSVLDPDALLDMVQEEQDRLIVQVTPTGTERRVASLDGLGSALSGSAPSRLSLLPMLPNTAFVGITALTGNLDPTPGSILQFAWNPVPLGKPEPLSMRIQRAFHSALNGSFGVSSTLCHEPPRRLQVSGDNIRNGAKLGLEATTAPGVIVWFDLAATSRDSGGHPIWETAEEIDGMQTYALLCGGRTAAGVLTMLNGDLTGATSLNPAANNLYRVHVENDDSTMGTSSWAPLTIVDAR